jgi:hypothetical protein
LYRKTIPHPGFEILKKIAEEKEKKKFGYWIFTSNVDGQFQVGGERRGRGNEGQEGRGRGR